LYITIDKFIPKFKSWNEGTSTLPSGLHLSHYKALVLSNDANPDTEEGKALEVK
jgi:hypothetical protein